MIQKGEDYLSETLDTLEQFVIRQPYTIKIQNILNESRSRESLSKSSTQLDLLPLLLSKPLTYYYYRAGI